MNNVQTVSFDKNESEVDPIKLLPLKLVEENQVPFSTSGFGQQHYNISTVKDFNVQQTAGAVASVIAIFEAPTTYSKEYYYANATVIGDLLEERERYLSSVEAIFFKAFTTHTKEILTPKSTLILETSGKFKFFKANELFDETKIDKEMTIEKFKKIRKKQHVPIEDYLYKERYE